VPLLLDTIENIRRRANPELRILGILPTLYHPRNTHDKEVLDELTATMAAQDLSPIDEYQAIARLIDKHSYSQGDAATALGKSRVSINEIMSLAGLATSILDDARAANVSKSILVEIARAGDETAQFRLWEGVRAGANTVRALRAQKKAAIEPTQKPSPIEAALRAGHRFAAALAAIPADDGTNIADVKSLVEQSLVMLDDYSLSK
jgi:ParB family transcriptional regulator, chromosome partitioning protein